MDVGYSSQERDGSRRAIASVREKSLRVQASLDELFSLAQHPAEAAEEWVEHYEGLARQLRMLRDAASEARILENWVVRPLTTRIPTGGVGGEVLLRTKLEPAQEKLDVALDEQVRDVGDVERQLRACNKLVFELQNAIAEGMMGTIEKGEGGGSGSSSDGGGVTPLRKRLKLKMDEAIAAFQVPQERPTYAPHPFDALLRLYKKGQDDEVELRRPREEVDREIEQDMLNLVAEFE